MATYLQQNLHFQPCPSSTIKKSFEKVLKDVGAKKAPTMGEQSWSLGQNVIYYSTRKTKTGVTLVYKVYEEQVFSEEHAKNVRTLINDMVTEMFSSKNGSPENPCLRSDEIAAYTIGKDVEESSNLRWIWAPLIGAICILFGILDFAGTFDSTSSKSDSNDPAYYYGTWVSDKGKSSQHPLGNPREDAAVYRKMINSGDIQGANQFADEVRDLYLQDFPIDRGAKLDEFWEWNARMK